MSVDGFCLLRSTKLRMRMMIITGVRPWGLSFTGRKGNSPDRSLRSLNLDSVLKVVERLIQLGGWLRSSHPLKKA
jgi:hypothetical protein